MTPVAVIAGAGPAGLTAALELLTQGGWQVIVCEASDMVGGIARTVAHNGNRMDLGGHRFFTKSERVNALWHRVLPKGEMLRRNRLSRIYYGGHFFDYPVSLSWRTLSAMGLAATLKAGAGYLAACLHKRPENSLEDFYINRFGRPLYEMFFESYTTKVWGRHPSELRADWGSQRVKGLSIAKVLANAARSFAGIKKKKEVETSLIDAFSYPRLGPGQMWEAMAAKIRELGGEIRFNCTVDEVLTDADSHITAVRAGGKTIACDAFFSSMPLNDLAAAMPGLGLPAGLSRDVAALPFRDFLTVGVLVNKPCSLPDNWIYLQDRHLTAGRLQVFNNWSEHLVADQSTTWLGLEFFCTCGDNLWDASDESLSALAVSELEKLGFADRRDVVDTRVLRVKSAYPGYFGTYSCVAELRRHLDRIDNLYCIGRNGQHRYNNMDHSMLTAMVAVDLLTGRATDRQALWEINTETDYHEENQRQE